MAVRKARLAGALFGLGIAGAAAAQRPATSPPFNVDGAAAVNACVAPRDRERAISTMTLAETRRVVACINLRMAQQINAQLPVTIDDVTILERLTPAGSHLTYQYRITRLRADLPDGVAAHLERTTRANVCAQDSMRRSMQMGGSYGYRWIDRNGAPIHQIRIERC